MTLHEDVLYGARLMWFAVSWPDNARSKRAWERSMEEAHSSHVWRIAEPVRPPHERWIVAGMAAPNARKSLWKMRAIIEEIGGFELWEPPEGFVNALALRRARMIMERTAKGDFGLKVNREMRTQMDRAGRMHRVDPDT